MESKCPLEVEECHRLCIYPSIQMWASVQDSHFTIRIRWIQTLCGFDAKWRLWPSGHPNARPTLVRPLLQRSAAEQSIGGKAAKVGGLPASPHRARVSREKSSSLATLASDSCQNFANQLIWHGDKHRRRGFVRLCSFGPAERCEKS